MFEKPQYLTPQGFRRSSGNPLKKKSGLYKRNLLEQQKWLTPDMKSKTLGTINPATAQLIAKAIKSLLNSNKK